MKINSIVICIVIILVICLGVLYNYKNKYIRAVNEPFYQGAVSNPVTIADIASSVMPVTQPIQYRLYLDGNYNKTLSGSQMLNPGAYNNTTNFKIVETPIPELQLDRGTGKLNILKPGNYMVCLNVNKFIKDLGFDTIIKLSLLAEQKNNNSSITLASEKTLNSNSNSYNFFSLSCIIDSSISSLNPQIYITDIAGNTKAFKPVSDQLVNDTFISVFIYSL